MKFLYLFLRNLLIMTAVLAAITACAILMVALFSHYPLATAIALFLIVILGVTYDQFIHLA